MSERLLHWFRPAPCPRGSALAVPPDASTSSPRCHTPTLPYAHPPLLSLTAGVGTDIGPETCTHWLTVLGLLSLSDPPNFPVAESKQTEGS